MNKNTLIRYLNLLQKERIKIVKEYEKDIKKYSKKDKNYCNNAELEYISILTHDIIALEKSIKELTTNNE